LNLSLAQEGYLKPARAQSKQLRTRENCTLDTVIFFALAALIALVAVPYGTVEAWWVAVYECLVFALGAVWIVRGLLTGTLGVSQQRLLVPLLLLVVFIFMQTLRWPGVAGNSSNWWTAISADPYETRLFAWKLLALILNGVLLWNCTSNRRRLRTLVYVIIGVGVASSLFGIVRQATQHSGHGFFLPYLRLQEGYGQFINPNHFALLIEMALGLALGLMLGGGVRPKRLLFYGAAVFPMWMALVLSSSRGGIISMLSQLLFLAVAFGIVRPGRDVSAKSSVALSNSWKILGILATRLALIICLLGAIAVGVVWMGGDLVVARLESLPNEIHAVGAEPHTGGHRIDVWRATWQLIKAHPLVGSGFGGCWTAITQYHDASGKYTPEAAHNDYLELLASGGLIGLSLTAWFVIALLKRASERIRSADSFGRAACFGALTGLFGAGIHSTVDFGLHITVNAVVFTTLVVIATKDRSIGDRAPESDKLRFVEAP
jgi:O-antigen ligase